MNMKKIGIILAGSLVGMSQMAFADNLMSIYHQAQHNDPTFQQAYATWMSARQDLPIARSGLFPTLSLSGGIERNYGKTEPNSGGNGYFSSNNYGLSITQPIFDFSTWASVKEASASVKAATATYAGSSQDLIYRTASSYFNVLQAWDELRYTIANKKAIYRQLQTAKEQYKVGLIAVTGVYDAQASYDSAVSQEITDRNNLSNAIEDLRAITAHSYHSLQALSQQVPLIQPEPSNIEKWVSLATTQNYDIKAAENTAIAAKEKISEKAAGRYPTLNATGSYEKTNYHNKPGGGDAATQSDVGLALNFPIFQGGLVSSSTKQARFDYLNSSSALELAHRTVVDATRQAYLGVISGISKVRADGQAIRSKEKKLESTKAGYSVGTRTMSDVLDALSDLYQTQQTYAKDQYDYIMSTLTLKKQAGTLSVADLHAINQLLTKTINVADSAAGAVHSQKQYVFHSKVKCAPYAIQLFAGKTGKSAESFVKSHAALGVLTIKPESINGTQWYKVFYGHYGSHRAAHNALAQLPPSLKVLNPWVTKVRD